jgi:hypothetical protein
LNSKNIKRGDNAKIGDTFAQLFKKNEATRKPPATDAPKTSSDSSLVLYDGHQTTLQCFVVILLVE